MKKFISLFSALILSFMLATSLIGCTRDSNNKDENNNKEENTKIELTTSSYRDYLNVSVSINPGTFKISTSAAGINGIYGVNGSGTVTLTISPKQPIKCYGVSFQFAKNSPRTLGTSGIELSTYDISRPIAVDAEGYATCTTTLTYDINNYGDFEHKIRWFGKTENDFRNDISNFQKNVYALKDSISLIYISNVSGYIVTI